MKIEKQKLNESKEKLPISFLTDFISRGWEDIGYLKETIRSIGENFSGSKKVEEWLQGLLDAYLVCIGQLELHAAAKDYLDTDFGENLEESKKLTEDIGITVNSEEAKIYDANGEEVAIIPVNNEDAESPAPAPAECEGPECDVPPVEANIPAVVEPTNEDPFEKPFDFDAPEAEGVRQFEKPEVTDYFVDFDDPVGEPVTEKDLYGDEDNGVPGETLDDLVKDNKDKEDK